MKYKTFVKATYVQDSKIFIFEVRQDDEFGKGIVLELDPIQFLGMAEYLAKVGVSYQRAKNKGEYL